MIERYTLPKMGKIWEDENRFRKMLDVEVFACEALSNLGKIPKDALSKIKKQTKIDVGQIKEIEKKTKHDVVAFVESIAGNIGDAGRFIHMGLTSSDVLDTSLAVMMKEASDILIDDLNKLLKVFADKAKRYKNTVCIGRSHGVHAEPTTFGLKMALFYEETKRSIKRMEEAKDVISVGKISGAVGTYSNIDPYVEEYVCKKLMLRPSPISNQILQRDRHAHFVAAIGIVGSSIDKFATEIRNLQRTEVLEVSEPFYSEQKGSSAMPHKRNPVTCERLSGLARLLRSNAQAAMENIVLWHERDISHSSVERVILPDSTILLDYMLNEFIEVVDNLEVYPENMKKNLDKTKGLIFSQRVLLELVNKGVSRQEAYKLVQKNAAMTWDKGKDFKLLLKQDSAIGKYLKAEEIDKCFALDYYLRNIDTIFARLGM